MIIGSQFVSVDFVVLKKFQEIDIRFRAPKRFTCGTTMVKSRLSPLNRRCLWLECRWLRRNSEASMKIIFNVLTYVTSNRIYTSKLMQHTMKSNILPDGNRPFSLN